MKAALAKGNAAAKASTFVVYPEAPHAFHADYRPSYRKEAAEDGWKRADGLVQGQRRGLTRVSALQSRRAAQAALFYGCLARWGTMPGAHCGI